MTNEVNPCCTLADGSLAALVPLGEPFDPAAFGSNIAALAALQVEGGAFTTNILPPGFRSSAEVIAGDVMYGSAPTELLLSIAELLYFALGTAPGTTFGDYRHPTDH